jgi:outer membrane protein assembly factor BamA
MEDFGQVGGRGWLEIDTRDNGAYPTAGFRILAGGSVFPALWDVEESFGTIEGAVSGFLSPGTGDRAPTLAFRGGGKKVFGTYPFHEAAFVGGQKDLRGFREERFAGDGSLYGNLELRLPVLKTNLLFPTELGFLGGVDTGRVFFEGDPDDTGGWHTGYGGGVWISLLDRAQTLSISVMRGDELTALYFQAGLHF